MRICVPFHLGIARNIWWFGPNGGSVQDPHVYIILCKYEVLADFNLTVAKADHHTSNFNSLPQNFLAIQYNSENLLSTLEDDG